MTISLNGYQLSPHFIEQLVRVPQIERETLASDLTSAASLLKPFRGKKVLAAQYKGAIWIFNNGVFATIYPATKITAKTAERMGWKR